MKKKENVKLTMSFVNMLNEYKLIFKEAFKISFIAVTISVSNAPCECSFSCMRRIKNSLRSTMIHDRL